MTFDRILVPLDGSRLAEAGLPPAEALARRLHSVLVFVHALEPDPPAAVHGEPHLVSFEDARAYLERHRERCSALGISAEVHVSRTQVQDVALAIDELARELDAGLIAMCAHGRRTLRGWLLGPVAQRALRGGSATILLRTAGATKDAPFDVRHILLPIDFSHDLDAALEAVATLARGFDAAVTLLNAPEPPAGLQTRLLPATSSMVRVIEGEEARERLTVLAGRLRADGIDADVVLSEGAADEAIIEQARASSTDLIVLVSHGRVGVSAWYERSIGQRMVEEPGLTLLLLRQL
jgi:nucleotide-binding universal stress UspA family protein